MSRWRHTRKNLSSVDDHGVVEKWWHGEKSYPKRDDPTITIEAFKQPDGSWMYMVQDSLNLAEREQRFTRSAAKKDALRRKELYKDYWM